LYHVMIGGGLLKTTLHDNSTTIPRLTVVSGWFPFLLSMTGFTGTQTHIYLNKFLKITMVREYKELSISYTDYMLRSPRSLPHMLQHLSNILRGGGGGDVGTSHKAVLPQVPVSKSPVV
jgi:hypothetical protein